MTSNHFLKFSCGGKLTSLSYLAKSELFQSKKLRILFSFEFLLCFEQSLSVDNFVTTKSIIEWE